MVKMVKKKVLNIESKPPNEKHYNFWVLWAKCVIIHRFDIIICKWSYLIVVTSLIEQKLFSSPKMFEEGILVLERFSVEFDERVIQLRMLHLFCGSYSNQVTQNRFFYGIWICTLYSVMGKHNNKLFWEKLEIVHLRRRSNPCCLCIANMILNSL